MKRISILGSTGSIGQNAIAVVRQHPERFRVVALAAKRNVSVLLKQIKLVRPKLVCVYEEDAAHKLEIALLSSRALAKTEVVSGDAGLMEVAAIKETDLLLCGIVGAAGLLPIFTALDAGKDIGIANKEPLVMAGDLIMKRAREKKVRVLPIDSEHSAIWQCLESVNGSGGSVVKKIILTASGGPFLGRRRASLKDVTPEEAVRHPRWRMGKKISVDSATLMNKGLEIKEAHHLFDIPINKIEVLIHPEAVVHSMVEFVDGSHIAQMAVNDMKLPIQYALSYPERLKLDLPTLDLAKIHTLTFEKPDRKAFPCLDLAVSAAKEGGTAPAVLNAANEMAVEGFLKGALKFLDIPRLIDRILAKHRVIRKPGLEDIIAADQWARLEVGRL